MPLAQVDRGTVREARAPIAAEARLECQPNSRQIWKLEQHSSKVNTVHLETRALPWRGWRALPLGGTGGCLERDLQGIVVKRNANERHDLSSRIIDCLVRERLASLMGL